MLKLKHNCTRASDNKSPEQGRAGLVSAAAGCLLVSECHQTGTPWLLNAAGWRLRCCPPLPPHSRSLAGFFTFPPAVFHCFFCSVFVSVIISLLTGGNFAVSPPLHHLFITSAAACLLSLFHRAFICLPAWAARPQTGHRATETFMNQFD